MVMFVKNVTPLLKSLLGKTFQKKTTLPWRYLLPRVHVTICNKTIFSSDKYKGNLILP